MVYFTGDVQHVDADGRPATDAFEVAALTASVTLEDRTRPGLVDEPFSEAVPHDWDLPGVTPRRCDIVVVDEA